MTKLVPYEAPSDVPVDDSPLGRPFRVDARLRNNRLIRAREEIGLSPRQAASAAGVGYQTLLDFESFRDSPWGKVGRGGKAEGWKRSAVRVAAFYGYSPEELWPEVIREVRARTASLEVGTPHLALAAGEDEHGEEERIARMDALRQVLGSIPPRDRQALEAAFGIGGPPGGEPTFADVGESMGVCVERARQLVARGLRRARDEARRAALIPPPAAAGGPGNTCPACAAVVLHPNEHRPRDGLVEREVLGTKRWVQGRTCDRVERLRLERNPVRVVRGPA